MRKVLVVLISLFLFSGCASISKSVKQVHSDQYIDQSSTKYNFADNEDYEKIKISEVLRKLEKYENRKYALTMESEDLLIPITESDFKTFDSLKDYIWATQRRTIGIKKIQIIKTKINEVFVKPKDKRFHLSPNERMVEYLKEFKKLKYNKNKADDIGIQRIINNIFAQLNKIKNIDKEAFEKIFKSEKEQDLDYLISELEQE